MPYQIVNAIDGQRRGRPYSDEVRSCASCGNGLTVVRPRKGIRKGGTDLFPPPPSPTSILCWIGVLQSNRRVEKVMDQPANTSMTTSEWCVRPSL